ncbi:MAG: BatD family protein [Rhodothermales bacterium]
MMQLGSWMKYGLLVVLLAVLTAASSWAQQVSVQASVGDRTVGTEEVVSYTIEVKGADLNQITTPQPPGTEGLVLMQTMPSTRRNVSFINGRTSQSIAFTWSFRPQREGQARILSTSLDIAGEAYTTRPIQLDVVPQAQRPARRQRTPASPFDPFRARQQADEPAPEIESEDIFIRVIPSKRSAYQNEQVRLEYQVFYRDHVVPRQYRLADSWDAEGFWREEFDVESRPLPRSQVVNGVRYNYITIKKAAVFPTRAGELRVDPLKIDAEVMARRRSLDPFDAFFSPRGAPEEIELASPTVRIESKPLPSGAPAGFQGAVGSYQLTAQYDRTELEVGESLKLTVRLTGAGNIATLDAPRYDPLALFEVYDPQVESTIARGGSAISGTKTFTYVLVPRSNGTFEMPPVEYAVFNPRTAQYETLRSDPVTITVTGEAIAPLAASATTASGLPVDDIATIMLGTESWQRIGRTPVHQRPWIYGLLLLPMMGLVGLLGYKRHVKRLTTDVGFARNRQAHPLAKKHLKTASQLMAGGQAKLFYAELEHAVMGFIGNRLNLSERGLTRLQLDTALAECGVDLGYRDDLRQLLDECDHVRFAPVLPDQAAMEHAQEKASRLIIDLDQQLSGEPAHA